MFSEQGWADPAATAVWRSGTISIFWFARRKRWYPLTVADGKVLSQIIDRLSFKEDDYDEVLRKVSAKGMDLEVVDEPRGYRSADGESQAEALVDALIRDAEVRTIYRVETWSPSWSEWDLQNAWLDKADAAEEKQRFLALDFKVRVRGVRMDTKLGREAWNKLKQDQARW